MDDLEAQIAKSLSKTMLHKGSVDDKAADIARFVQDCKSQSVAEADMATVDRKLRDASVGDIDLMNGSHDGFDGSRSWTRSPTMPARPRKLSTSPVGSLDLFPRPCCTTLLDISA